MQTMFAMRQVPRSLILSVLQLVCFHIGHIEAAYVQFSNCLGSGVVKSDPRILQIVPLNATAVFDTTNSAHNLNVTFYGNVTGQLTRGNYPPASDPSWTNPNETFGKIQNLIDGDDKLTTLFSSYNVLTYMPYEANASRFCGETINQQCPIAPSFNISRTDIADLPGWSVAHDMGASYAFTEIVVHTRVQSGSDAGNFYACINAYITPDFGDSLRDLLRYLPLAVLVFVGVGTISAAMFSPWGSWDIFKWTSNSGRDEDVLRLVTPGFADCLQYLQFIVLTGSLSLNYPGFYQPVVSRVGWSSLLFNESFVSHGPGVTPVVDGVYSYRDPSNFGLDRMTQLIGMTAASDAWAAMMIWLVVIVVAAVVLTQIGFALRWMYRMVKHTPPEDFRSKNWYFSVGNVIRVTLGFFILPLISISMFQFVIATRSPIYLSVLAAVVLLAIIAFMVRLVFVFARIKPRSLLFDDLQCVLEYGPLYNTYRDDAATFAFIPILVNFLRGIAIGAVQASGVAQIVLLAISEIIFILTINALRPYPAATSMNLYHTFFSIIRLITVLLSIAFIPALNINGGSRGWIGYIVLLIHACVLVFGFFLNAIQTLIEVIARLAGAGGSGASDAARGGLTKVFGVRQLSKRMNRSNIASRNSMASNAAMLHSTHEVSVSPAMKTRSRSVSASSTMLLDNNMRSPARDSQVYAGTSDGQITPDASSTFSMGHRQQRSTGSGIVNLPRQAEVRDPYYRPPRRNTAELLQQGNQFPLTRAGIAGNNTPRDLVDDRAEGSSTPFKAEDFEDGGNELNSAKTDYAVREVDFYYGVRGPALSSGTRKLKTGPADPTGPVSNAPGWFKGLLGGRQKEKTKGFEVVRSARAPPPGLVPSTDFDLDPEPSEPYRDSPTKDDTRSAAKLQGRTHPSERRRMFDDDDDRPQSASKILSEPPVLPLIDPVGDIELPSRVNSAYSKARSVRKVPEDPMIPEVPSLPRRSSRRTSSVDSTKVTSNRQSLAGHPSTRLPFAPTQTTEAAAGVGDLASGTAVDDGELVNAPGNVADGSGDVQPSNIGFVKGQRTGDAITHQSVSPAAKVAGKTVIIQHKDHP